MESKLSLDITLVNPSPTVRVGTGVFVREGGTNKELTAEECRSRWPDCDITDEQWETDHVFHLNLTHNLNTMADAAGLYEVLWRPETIGVQLAYQAIESLASGYDLLLQDPIAAKALNPSNGWGTYEQLVEGVRDYIIACARWPHARIEISR